MVISVVVMIIMMNGVCMVSRRVVIVRVGSCVFIWMLVLCCRVWVMIRVVSRVIVSSVVMWVGVGCLMKVGGMR